MNNQPITKKEAHKIIENGIFYYPAYEHYGNTEGNIVCDFCSKSNLKCCIGYQDSDLCLKCSETIANRQPNIEPMTQMMEDLCRPDYLPMTRMKQDSVRTMTKMKQSSVRKIDRPVISSITTNMMQDSTRSKFKDRDDDSDD